MRGVLELENEIWRVSLSVNVPPQYSVHTTPQYVTEYGVHRTNINYI